MKNMIKNKLTWLSLIVFSISFFGAIQVKAQSLFDMNVEELMQTEVISAMRKPQTVSETASAIYVITQEDIKRSGATSLPEMLRMAPGLEVAQIGQQRWKITARGFNSIFADKLLVMIDGRTVYTPLHGGIYWDAQDSMAEDIERIEVIRGPGGSLWGSNAINGIINVITKSSRDTHGGLLVAGGGNHERNFVSLRQGDTLTDQGDYRVYIKGFTRHNGVQFYTDPQIEQRHHIQGGFRTDWQLSNSNELTVQGDIYKGTKGLETTLTSLAAPYNASIADVEKIEGRNLTTHWTKDFSSTSQLSIQAYYDYTYRKKQSFLESRDTYDIDLQHRFNLTTHNELTWGLSYRESSDWTEGSFFSSLTPASATLHIASVMIQDEFLLLDNKLRIMLGSKLEKNDYTGLENQPSLKVLWHESNYSLWASINRAARIPSRAERSLTHNFFVIPPSAMGPGSPATPITLLNNPNLGAMYVTAFEIGGRGQLSPKLSYDITGFKNVYTDLTGVDVLGFDNIQTNSVHGITYGVEALLRWQISDGWRMSTSYSWLKAALQTDSVKADHFNPKGSSPEQQFRLQSSYNLSEKIAFDLFFYHVSSIAYSSVNIPAYNRTDLRFSWKARKDIEFSVVGQSLFGGTHIETTSVASPPYYQVPQSVYGKVTWIF